LCINAWCWLYKKEHLNISKRDSALIVMESILLGEMIKIRTKIDYEVKYFLCAIHVVLSSNINTLEKAGEQKCYVVYRLAEYFRLTMLTMCFSHRWKIMYFFPFFRCWKSSIFFFACSISICMQMISSQEGKYHLHDESSRAVANEWVRWREGNLIILDFFIIHLHY
jgi:hypothetical protein